MTIKTNQKEKEISLHIGNQIRELRKLQDTMLSTLAARIGLSYQQLQKYEYGTNRISAAKLYMVARAFHVSPVTFFEGLPHMPPSFSDDPELIRALLYIKQNPHSEYIGNVLKLLSKEI